MTPTKTKIKYANFPEREFKVVLGDNINVNTGKTLCRMSIGTYEMSFTQQERLSASAEAVRYTTAALGRLPGYTVTSEKSRDYVSHVTVATAEHLYDIWVTTPFELTQTSHIVWCKFVELEGDKKIGVSFKLATGFSADDITNVMKAAQKNAVVVPEGEPYTLKGNPPPRFQKKAAAPAAEVVAEETAPAEPAAG